jgi:hypothetical protein
MNQSSATDHDRQIMAGTVPSVITMARAIDAATWLSRLYLRILSPARLPSAWYWSDIGLTLISRIFEGLSITPRIRLHCSRIGLARATCAEELQKVVQSNN